MAVGFVWFVRVVLCCDHFHDLNTESCCGFLLAEAHPEVITSEAGATEEAYRKDLAYLKEKVGIGLVGFLGYFTLVDPFAVPLESSTKSENAVCWFCMFLPSSGFQVSGHNM